MQCRKVAINTAVLDSLDKISFLSNVVMRQARSIDKKKSMLEKHS